MKMNDVLNKGDIVRVINTHKNKSGYDALYVVTGFKEYWGYKNPRIFVEAVMIAGSYKDWNGYYGRTNDVIVPENGIIFKFGKRALELVRKGS